MTAPAYPCRFHHSNHPDHVHFICTNPNIKVSAGRDPWVSDRVCATCKFREADVVHNVSFHKSQNGTLKLSRAPISLPQCQELGRALRNDELAAKGYDVKSCQCEQKIRFCSVHDLCTTGSNNQNLASCENCTEHTALLPALAQIESKSGAYVRNKRDHAVILAHQLALRRFIKNIPAYPADLYSHHFQYKGRGIVIATGGKYWPPAYITLRMIRTVGCNLPVQMWYMGARGERDITFEKYCASWGPVEFIDANEVAKSHPCRILAGYEVKLFSVMNSPFEEVLFLGSDCYPVSNPEFLFELDGFKQTGAIFFPDLTENKDWLDWETVGISRFGQDAAWETGQYLINKRTAWRALQISRWLDDHSDYYYGVTGNGDTGTLRAGFAAAGHIVMMFNLAPKWRGFSFVHDGPGGQELFVHRVQNKFTLQPTSFYSRQPGNGPVRNDSLPLEDQAWFHYNNLVVQERIRKSIPA